ncbi:unnamed protein product, partial [Mycena citricolor]
MYMLQPGIGYVAPAAPTAPAPPASASSHASTSATVVTAPAAPKPTAALSDFDRSQTASRASSHSTGSLSSGSSSVLVISPPSSVLSNPSEPQRYGHMHGRPYEAFALPPIVPPPPPPVAPAYPPPGFVAHPAWSAHPPPPPVPAPPTVVPSWADWIPDPTRPPTPPTPTQAVPPWEHWRPGMGRPPRPVSPPEMRLSSSAQGSEAAPRDELASNSSTISTQIPPPMHCFRPGKPAPPAPLALPNATPPGVAAAMRHDERPELVQWYHHNFTPMSDRTPMPSFTMEIPGTPAAGQHTSAASDNVERGRPYELRPVSPVARVRSPVYSHPTSIANSPRGTVPSPVADSAAPPDVLSVRTHSRSPLRTVVSSPSVTSSRLTPSPPPQQVFLSRAGPVSSSSRAPSLLYQNSPMSTPRTHSPVSSYDGVHGYPASPVVYQLSSGLSTPGEPQMSVRPPIVTPVHPFRGWVSERPRAETVSSRSSSSETSHTVLIPSMPMPAQQSPGMPMQPPMQGAHQPYIPAWTTPWPCPPPFNPQPTFNPQPQPYTPWGYNSTSPYPFEGSQYSRHPRFWFEDGNVTYVIQNMEYKLHRYHFNNGTWASSNAWPGYQSSRFELFENKIDFERFLTVLYPLFVVFPFSFHIAYFLCREHGEQEC